MYCYIGLSYSCSDDGAQVLLMSGMGNRAFANVCSLRSTEDRIDQWNNALPFVVFKKDPWNAAYGGDP
jgi:hypothetical protein